MKRAHALGAAVGVAVGVAGTIAVQRATAPPATLVQQLQRLPPGSAFTIPPGTYAGEVVLHNPQRLTLRGAGAVTFSNGSDYGLKLDGGRDVSLSGIAFSHNRGHGLMAVNVDGLTVDHCTADANQTNGFLTGDSRRVTVTNSRARNNVGGHGCYLSQKGDGYLIQACTFTGNGRCGVQINAHPGGASGVRVLGNDLRFNPTAGLQLAAVKMAVVAGNTVGSNRSGTVVWDDGSGSAWACDGIDLTGQAGTFNIAKNSKNVKLPAKSN